MADTKAEVLDDEQEQQVKVPVSEAPDVAEASGDETKEAQAEEAKEEPPTTDEVPEADRAWHEKTYRG